MYRKKTIGVVIPAHNEQKHIAKVITTLPSFVDKIIVVDDASTDRTLAILKRHKHTMKDRLVILHHAKNRGVGGGLITGYKMSVKLKMDYVAAMAGDAQTDPKDLHKLIDAVIDDGADYAKGNRLLHGQVKRNMPHLRYFGNSLLTVLNKISTGYWKTMDPQCGYTVVTREVLETIPVDDIYPRYGVPNDILAKLNVYNFRVKDVIINPIYKDERSGIRLYSFIPKVSFLLMRKFFWRLKEKYLYRDFHPLALFYALGLFLLPIGFIYGLFILINRFSGYGVSINAVVLCVFLLLMGFQFLFFGMLFDMEYNKELNLK